MIPEGWAAWAVPASTGNTNPANNVRKLVDGMEELPD
jgi:hypothetical protein